MNPFGLRFHHLGLAVTDPDAAAVFLEGLGYSRGKETYDPLQVVNLILYDHATSPTVELIYGQGGTDGPLGTILKKRREMIYHTCYETENLDVSLRSIEAAGLRVMMTSSPKPAILFAGRHVSFHYVDGFGLIELLEAA